MMVGPALPKSQVGGPPDPAKMLAQAITCTLAIAVPFLKGGLAGAKQTFIGEILIVVGLISAIIGALIGLVQKPN